MIFSRSIPRPWRKREVGEEIVKGGTLYRAVAIEPYERKTDGFMSQLVTWRARCHVCGALFTVQSGARPATLKKNCPAHESTRAPRKRDPRYMLASTAKKLSKRAIRFIETGDNESARRTLLMLIENQNGKA